MMFLAVEGVARAARPKPCAFSPDKSIRLSGVSPCACAVR
jgi:hypothetical protein